MPGLVKVTGKSNLGKFCNYLHPDNRTKAFRIEDPFKKADKPLLSASSILIISCLRDDRATLIFEGNDVENFNEIDSSYLKSMTMIGSLGHNDDPYARTLGRGEKIVGQLIVAHFTSMCSDTTAPPINRLPSRSVQNFNIG